MDSSFFKILTAAEQQQPHSSEEVLTVINPADCSLDFRIEPNKLTGFGDSLGISKYRWPGARGNIGITGGKYCFGCTIEFHQPVMMEGTPPDQQHVTRVGISRGDTPVDSLGQTEHSFGYDGNKQFLNAGRVEEYGETFGQGDTIVCSVNLERKPYALVEFSKNGKRLGLKDIIVTSSLAGKLPWDSVLFPHVLIKNTKIRFQFNANQGLFPEEGYKPWDLAMEDGNAIFGPASRYFKYSGHPLGVQTGTGRSWIDWSEPAAQVNPANVNRGYATAAGPLLSDLMLPYSNNVNLTELSRGEAQWHHNSVSSASMMSASSLPGPGSQQLGFPSPSLEIRTDLGTGGSWIGQSEPTFQTNYANVSSKSESGQMQPISNNVKIEYPLAQQLAALELKESHPYKVDIGHTGAGRPNILESMRPFSNNVNTMPESSVHSNRLDPSSEPYVPLRSLNPMPTPDWYPVHEENRAVPSSRLDPSSEPYVPLGSSNPMATPDWYPIHEENRGYPIMYSDLRNPVSGNNLSQNGSYVHDSNGTHEPRSDYRPPYVLQHGTITPNPMLQRSYPADGQPRGSGTAPYHPPKF